MGRSKDGLKREMPFSLALTKKKKKKKKKKEGGIKLRQQRETLKLAGKRVRKAVTEVKF